MINITDIGLNFGHLYDGNDNHDTRRYSIVERGLIHNGSWEFLSTHVRYNRSFPKQNARIRSRVYQQYKHSFDILFSQRYFSGKFLSNYLPTWKQNRIARTSNLLFLQTPGFLVDPFFFAFIMYVLVGLRNTWFALLCTIMINALVINTSAAFGKWEC